MTKVPSDSKTYLSNAGGQPLEYIYLSGITGNTEYKDRVVKIRTFLKNKDKPDGLYPRMIGTDGNWISGKTPSLNWHGSAFYFNLLNSHLQSNRRDMESLVMYREAIDSMIEAKMFSKSNSCYDYATDYGESEMYYTYCYLGAMLSRGAAAINHSLADHRSTATRHQELAQGITRTCYTATNRTKTGLTSDYIIWKNKLNGYGPYFLR